MAETIFNESLVLVNERERGWRTACHLIDESGVEPGPGFCVDVERVRTRSVPT